MKENAYADILCSWNMDSFSTQVYDFFRRHREFLSEVYLPVIKMLLEAPPTSPLTEIDVGNVADFIVQLTKPTGPSVCLSLSYSVL